MKLSKQALSAVSLVGTVLLVIFAGRYISQIIRGNDFSTISINWLFAGLSAALFAAFYGVLSLHWVKACRLIRGDAETRQFLAFFASQPYKYLPTSLFTFSFRALYARKAGLGLKQSSLAQVLENGSMLAANLGVFIVMYLTYLEPLLGLAAILGGVLLCFVPELCSWRQFTVRIKKRSLTLQTNQVRELLLTAAIAWLIAGLAFLSLNHALGFTANVFAFFAANSLAFSLGLIAFFAPGGIGIREVVYSMFSVSGIVIVCWRILTFVLDCLLGLAAIVVLRLRFSPLEDTPGV